MILDDDILLGRDWYRAMRDRGDDWDILTSRILLPDGLRYWDYATVGGPRRHRLLRHDEPSDDFVYMSGGTAWVMKDYVAEAVRWDSDLGFYQEEDTRFSRRCVEAGFQVTHNPGAVAYHYDSCYTRVGRSIVKRSRGMDHLWLITRHEELADPNLLFKLVEEKAAARQVAELADCLRAGMQFFPHDARFPKVWAALEEKFNGDAGGDRWSVNGDPSFKALLANLAPRHIAAAAPHRALE